MAYAAFSTAYTPEPTSCASGPKPGAVALQRWACDESPWGADLWDVGIYACRDVYGGWCPNCNRSALSAHASGRAGDSAHNIINGRSHPSGKAFAAWLVRNHAVLGVQEVISDYQRWTNQTREWRAYTGRSPHTDHVHWALNTSGGTYLTRARILSVAPGQTVPAPIASPPEVDVFAVTQKSTGNVWLLEDGRRTLVPSGDRTAVKAAVPHFPVSDGFFDDLIRDRVRYQ
jgi:hypothetical protein